MQMFIKCKLDYINIYYNIRHIMLNYCSKCVYKISEKITNVTTKAY